MVDAVTLGGLRRLKMPTLRNLVLKANTTSDTSLFYQSVSNSLTAAGTNQSGALALTNIVNVLTTVGANSGVSLPSTAVVPSSGPGYVQGFQVPGYGQTVYVINTIATAVQVYGAGTDTINGIATATGFTQPGLSIGTYTATASGTWNGATDGFTNTGSGSSVLATNPTLTAIITDSITASGNASGGFIDAVTAGTTVSNFSNNGITTFGSSIAKTYTLNAPSAGAQKFLHFNGSGIGNVSTAVMTVFTGSSLVTIGQPGSSFTNILMGSTVFSDFAVGLHGESSTKWVITSLVTQGATSGAFGSTALGITLST